jgi:hypothetical protein
MPDDNREAYLAGYRGTREGTLQGMAVLMKGGVSTLAMS